MNLSNTGGGGRGDDKGDVVGSMILHGKKQFWLRGGNYHYHHGMVAGENTLDALVTRELTRSMVSQEGRFSADDFRTKYITFMTTPGSHNDTYAGTCHRMFFKNLRDGVPPERCPDNDAHNVDAIDALMVVPPVTVAHLRSSPSERAAAIRAAIQTTRNTEAVLRFATVYSDMLLAVLAGESVANAAQTAGLALGIDIAAQVRRSRTDPMVACYVDSAFPALLFFAHKYGDQGVEALLLASANAGGENVARGSLLGALAGASCGKSGIPASLLDGLVLGAALQRESEQLVELVTAL